MSDENTNKYMHVHIVAVVDIACNRHFVKLLCLEGTQKHETGTYVDSIHQHRLSFPQLAEA